jgi:hypothetical protein
MQRNAVHDPELDPGMEKKIVIKNIIDHLVKSEYRVDIN